MTSYVIKHLPAHIFRINNKTVGGNAPLIICFNGEVNVRFMIDKIKGNEQS